LRQPPVVQRGTTFYSNRGYLIATRPEHGDNMNDWNNEVIIDCFTNAAENGKSEFL